MRVRSGGLFDQRRYNRPTVDEVAMIFVGNDGAPPTNRDIVVYPRAAEKTRISDLHDCVDPMSYPLLVPRGEPRGWTTTLEHSAGHRSAAQKRIKRTRAAVSSSSTASTHTARRRASAWDGFERTKTNFARKNMVFSKTGRPRSKPGRRLSPRAMALPLRQRWVDRLSCQAPSEAVRAPCR